MRIQTTRLLPGLLAGAACLGLGACASDFFPRMAYEVGAQQACLQQQENKSAAVGGTAECYTGSAEDYEQYRRQREQELERAQDE